jgi:hypothetical protein
VGKIQSKEVNVNESKKILVWFRKGIFLFFAKVYDKLREYFFSFSFPHVFLISWLYLTMGDTWIAPLA